MTQQLTDNYIKALYLKSKDNYRNGYNYNIIAKLISIDKTTGVNIMHYLSGKGLISTNSNFGENISLTSEGIDYVNKLKENKIFKTIRFKKAD